MSGQRKHKELKTENLQAYTKMAMGFPKLTISNKIRIVQINMHCGWLANMSFKTSKVSLRITPGYYYVNAADLNLQYAALIPFFLCTHISSPNIIGLVNFNALFRLKKKEKKSCASCYNFRSASMQSKNDVFFFSFF